MNFTELSVSLRDTLDKIVIPLGGEAARLVPHTTEDFSKGVLSFIAEAFPGEDIGLFEKKVEFLEQFRADDRVHIKYRIAALNALAVIHMEREDYASALLFAEHVLEIWSEDLFNHYLITEIKEKSGFYGNEMEPLDSYLKTHFCNTPFRHFETTEKGEVYLCCPSWVPLSAGNIFSKDPSEVWNSESARAVRRSIFDGEFKYCSRLYCHLIQSRTLPPRAIDVNLDVVKFYDIYKEHNIWTWNALFLATPISEQPDADELKAGGVNSYISGPRLEDVKDKIEENLSRAKKDMAPAKDLDEDIIDTPKPRFHKDTLKYCKDLESDYLDSYEYDGLFYAVPSGEKVSPHTLRQRLNSHVICATSREVLGENIRLYHENLKLDVLLRPYSHWEYMPRGPFDAMLSHDRTCNISCPSCRRHLIIATHEEREQFDVIVHALLNFLKPTHFISITGSGDPFASKHYRQVMRHLKGALEAKITLHTNALLWDERAWKELELEGRVSHATLSIDAASKETFEKVRRGSSWNTLLERLDFIASLRQRGAVPRLATNFTVQGSNFREMPAFVAFAFRHQIDHVRFSIVKNIGAYSYDEFMAENIANADHPEHADFVKLLRDPIFDDPRVDLTNCLPYRSRSV